jgi:Arc/MetJ family transcription regulator
MRTNIHLDDELMARAMALTGKRTKRAVVEEALRTVLRLHGQREVRDLRGRLHWEGEETSVADPR